MILIGGGLDDGSENAPLARELAEHFTVYNFARRGRGDSRDTQPDAVKRELDDIAAIIAEAGGSVHLFGVSSGGMFALEVAAAGYGSASSDRGEYLVAAANLSRYIAQSKRDEFFDTAVLLATSPTPSDHGKLNEQFTHKLGGFRMNGTPRDSRGQAVLLAAAPAENDDQRERVRRLAYSLLGQESDYWPTRALQYLGDTIKDDLAFLASQGWAIRSLAAILWVDLGDPAHLGNRLAADPDVRVRRAVASALSQQPERSHPTVREQLVTDPAYSVRAALRTPPIPPSTDNPT